MKKERTIQTSMRIPVKLYETIQQEAKQQNTQFSKVAVKLMHNGLNGLDPATMAGIQNVMNLCVEAIRTGEDEKLKEAQKGVDELWKSLK